MNATAIPRRAAGVRIAGTGMFVPAKILTNQDLTKLIDTSDQWITQRTGIKQRRISEPGTTIRDLALPATRQAIANAGIAPTDLELLICATLTPEMAFPSSAARLVDALGSVPAGAVDVSAACSGFVYGINMAAGLIHSGMYKTIAVVGTEVLSAITNWEDRQTCVLFGDGAGAAVLTACDNVSRGCVRQTMSSDGSRWKDLYCPRNQSDLPPGDTIFSGKFNTLQMNGREIYRFAVGTLQKAIDQTLAAAGITPADLAMVIPHQSNLRIIESAREKLGLPPEKMYVNIDRYGNTSAASVPICLHELTQAGRIKPGDLVLFIALGAGLTWTTSLWRM